MVKDSWIPVPGLDSAEAVLAAFRALEQSLYRIPEDADEREEDRRKDPKDDGDRARARAGPDVGLRGRQLQDREYSTYQGLVCA